MNKIVWDWNGTLLDDVDLCFACINRLLQKEDLTVLEDLDAYRNIFDFPIQDYYQKAGFDFEKTSWPALAHAYMEDYMSKSHNCSLTPFAKVTLKKAKEYGYDNIILSASDLDNLKYQLAHYDFNDTLDAVYGIHDIYAHSKVELAEEFKATCMPDDVIWCVGDTLHDAKVAAVIGANCILVSTGHQSRSRLEKAGVPVVDTVKEALEIIHERSSH